MRKKSINGHSTKKALSSFIKLPQSCNEETRDFEIDESSSLTSVITSSSKSLFMQEDKCEPREDRRAAKKSRRAETEESLSRKSSSDIIKTTFFYLIFYRKNAFKALPPERKPQKRFIIDKYKNILYDNSKG